MRLISGIAAAFSTERSKDALLLAPCLALALLSLLPAVRLVLAQADLATFYGENVGFRFFWAMRWVDGTPDDFIHPGQGSLLPFIQAAYYILGKHLHTQLFDQITFFGLCTLGIPLAANALLAVTIARDGRLAASVRAILILFIPMVLASHMHVFTYSLYPDYMAYERVLLLLCLYAFLLWFWQQDATIAHSISYGCLIAAAGALKINMGIFPAALPLLALAQKKCRVRHVATAWGISGLAYAALMAAYYGFDAGRLIEYYRIVFAFSGFPWGFDWSAMSPFASFGEHSMSNLTWLLALLLAAIVWRVYDRREFLLSGFIIAALACLAFLMCVKRGGGVSYLEAVLIATLLICTAAAVGNAPRLLRCTAVTAFAAWPLAWMTLFWTPFSTAQGHIHDLTKDRTWQARIYDWNLRQNLPIVGLFPSNSFAVGSVEDMMLRGFSNFSATWYTANANPSLRQLFPWHRYGTYDLKVPEGPFVFETVVSDVPFPLVDAATLATHKAMIARILAGRTVGPCFSVAPPHLNGARVQSCRVE